MSVQKTVLSAEQLLAIAESGLPVRGGGPKKIVVIGAGMAGLVTAQALIHVGHDVLILEAQARVGGRVQTLREPFTDGLYAEAGAMRIPRSHSLTLSYLRRFGIRVRPFTASNPQAYYYLHGQKRRIADVACDPDLLCDALGEHERADPSATGGKPPSPPFPSDCGQRERRPGTRLSPSTTAIRPGSFWSAASGPRAPSRSSACSPTRKP